MYSSWVLHFSCQIVRFYHINFIFFIKTRKFLSSLNVLNFLIILGSNVLQIVTILRVIFLQIFEKLHAVYTVVSETFYLENLKNKAMTASVYGHDLAAKFQKTKFENFAMFINCIDLFCSFVLFINFKMRIGFFFNFSSEAEHVLALFLFFGQIEPRCSYKVRSYKKRNVVFKTRGFRVVLLFDSPCISYSLLSLPYEECLVRQS